MMNEYFILFLVIVCYLPHVSGLFRRCRLNMLWDHDYGTQGILSTTITGKMIPHTKSDRYNHLFHPNSSPSRNSHLFSPPEPIYRRTRLFIGFRPAPEDAETPHNDQTSGNILSSSVEDVSVLKELLSKVISAFGRGKPELALTAASERLGWLFSHDIPK